MDEEMLEPVSPRTKRRWSDLTAPQKTAIVVVGAIELAMTIAALRDLKHRPTAQVRGRKAVWVLAFVVQPFGPLSYFVLGKRRPPT